VADQPGGHMEDLTTTLALAVALVTGLVTIWREWRNRSLHKEIADLQQQLNNSLKQQRQAQQDTDALRAQVDLRKQLATANGGTVYYRSNSKGIMIAGPFCVRCQDADAKLVHLHVRNEGLACPQCGAYAAADRPMIFDHRLPNGDED
jgi:hypothetical protein